jgi:hypothetical protein
MFVHLEEKETIGLRRRGKLAAAMAMSTTALTKKLLLHLHCRPPMRPPRHQKNLRQKFLLLMNWTNVIRARYFSRGATRKRLLPIAVPFACARMKWETALFGAALAYQSKRRNNLVPTPFTWSAS